MRTIIWFCWFWLQLIGLLPVLHKGKKALQQGKNAEVDQLVEKMVPKWANGLLKLAGVTVDVKGKENIPSNQAVVFVANHRSYYDIPLMLTSLDKPHPLVAKKEIEKIIRSCGSYTKKADYIIKIAQSLITNYNGVVPNDRAYLESLPGVGRKTANVVLSNLFNVPTIAVDTHVERVSKRLKIARSKDSVLGVEKKLMKMIPENLWSRSHHQLVLFGRYICKARSPLCEECKFYDDCSSKDKKKLYQK